MDAAGGQSTVDRNPTGFRFLVDGNGALLINEGGYQRPSSTSAPLAWFRVGYMRNSTHYLNRDTGGRESNNYCAYVLMDYQLRMLEDVRQMLGTYMMQNGVHERGIDAVFRIGAIRR